MYTFYITVLYWSGLFYIDAFKRVYVFLQWLYYSQSKALTNITYLRPKKSFKKLQYREVINLQVCFDLFVILNSLKTKIIRFYRRQKPDSDM